MMPAVAMEISKQQEQLAEKRYRHILDEQHEFQWIVFDDGEAMSCRVFFPKGHSKKSMAPAVVFFHGGQWNLPADTEFVPWALHLRDLGIVSIVPEFRLMPGFDVKGRDVLADAREMWEWVKENAGELGIDGARITVAGHDAGGLMALHIALPDVPARRRWFSKHVPLPKGPAAVALFRSVVDMESPDAAVMNDFFDEEERRRLNPLARLQRGLPPLFASHGASDRILLSRNSQEFCREWKKHGNKAEFFVLDSADHAYMHFNVNPATFESTLNGWVRFMSELGIWLTDESSENLLLL